MISVSIVCAVPPSGSVTLKVKFVPPEAVGMPVILPVEPSKLNPAGSVLETNDQMLGLPPPA